MRQRTTIRYSTCFKRQVVEELEAGRFDSITAAHRHYDIRGATTIQRWLRQFGKDSLSPRVIRVQKPDEPDQIRQLKQQIAKLEQALGQTQAKSLINEACFKLACEELGQDPDDYKKKCDGRLSASPNKPQS